MVSDHTAFDSVLIALRPGDPVMCEDNGVLEGAMVVAITGHCRCLIQLDPPAGQEPFDVDSSVVTYMGDLEGRVG